jgi:hypothetical protein
MSVGNRQERGVLESCLVEPVSEPAPAVMSLQLLLQAVCIDFGARLLGLESG